MAAKISLILNALLIVAVIYLFTTKDSGKNSSLNENSPVMADSTATQTSLKIAYVNVDSLMSNYLLANDIMDKLYLEERLASGRIQARQESIAQEMQTYEQNVYAGIEVPASEDEYISKMSSFQQRAMDIENSELKKYNALSEKLNDSLMTVIDDYVERLIEKTDIDYIFKDAQVGGPLLYSNNEYDLTDQIVNELNSEFEAREETGE